MTQGIGAALRIALRLLAPAALVALVFALTGCDNPNRDISVYVRSGDRITVIAWDRDAREINSHILIADDAGELHKFVAKPQPNQFDE